MRLEMESRLIRETAIMTNVSGLCGTFPVPWEKGEMPRFAMSFWLLDLLTILSQLFRQAQLFLLCVGLEVPSRFVSDAPRKQFST